MFEKSFFDKLTDASSAATSHRQLKVTLGRLAKANGFNHFAYLSLNANQIVAISDYPREWQKLYFARSYTEVDPVVFSARNFKRTFAWSVDFARKETAADVRQFLGHAADFGLRCGVSIPVRTGFGGMAILTLVSSHTVKLELDQLPEESQIAAATAVALIHARFREYEARLGAGPEIQLSGREVSCLRWSAEGKTLHDIAVLEDMTFSNVRYHVGEAKKKLGAVTLPQATATAVRSMLI
jgi:LuxR family transcriptional activator of conjugal transfer of Ti plasmids